MLGDIDGVDVADLRFGAAPLPDPQPGYDPLGDARALVAPGLPSPAAVPVPGRQYLGSYAVDERFVVRIPAAWNGELVVAGTPGWRCEFANDGLWSDYLLARGYAYACSNKALPYGAIVEDYADSPDPSRAYRIPFDLLGLGSGGATVRIGMLHPRPVSIAAWDADFVALTTFAKDLLKWELGKSPRRTYAVGLSNGGAQVRSLLERRGDLVDGGVEWSGVYWSPDATFFDALPAFVAALPEYVRSGFADRAAAARIEGAGFPPDLRQDDPAHPSLWADYYSYTPSFYADLTVFAYALLLDPEARATLRSAAFTPDAADPEHLPGTVDGSGLATPQGRAAYVPSAAARAAIAPFAHTGRLERPLISIAGAADMFIAPRHHAEGYAGAVVRAGRGERHRSYVVAGGTHVDAFVAHGYGLRPMAPFAWAAFERLVRAVAGRTPLGGEIRRVADPGEL